MSDNPITLKISSVYIAFSPELGLVSYGNCLDEALNNLQDELKVRQNPSDNATDYEKE